MQELRNPFTPGVGKTVPLNCAGFCSAWIAWMEAEIGTADSGDVEVEVEFPNYGDSQNTAGGRAHYPELSSVESSNQESNQFGGGKDGFRSDRGGLEKNFFRVRFDGLNQG